MKKYLCLLALFFLTGCNRYTEVNQLGIVEVLAITKEDAIKETVSMTIPQKEKKKYQLLSSQGSSLGNAFLNLQNAEERKVYFDQTQILLLNPTILKEEMSSLLPFLLTNFRHPNWLVFLCTQCEEILAKEKQHTFYENLVRKEHARSGNIGITTFEDFTAFYLDETLTASLPFLSINEEQIEITSLVAFTNQQQDIEFTKEEAKVLSLLKQKITTLEEIIPFEEQMISVSLEHIKTALQLQQKEIVIHLQGTYRLNDTVKEDKNLEQKITAVLQQKIQNFLQKEQEENIDLLGITHLFYVKTRNLSQARKLAQTATFKLVFDLQKEGDKT